jgi:ankyrin repeat protein
VNLEAVTQKEGKTALHIAVMKVDLPIISILVEAGANLEATTQNEGGETALHIAVRRGNLDIVKILCAAGANLQATTHTEGETALHIAIRHGRNDILEELLSHRPNLDVRALRTSETPLHYAVAKSGSLATVVDLLERGANYEALDSEGRSAAELAISNENINAAVAIVKMACGNRTKLAKEKDMLVRHVEQTKNRSSMDSELIADIFEAGCKPESTVLVEAIEKNDVALAELFLQRGADPNQPTSSGLYPIFVALECSGAQMIQLLAKHGADATVENGDGLTVLQAALASPSAANGQAIQGMFEALISCGADPKITYPDGKTLLHHVVSPPLRHPKLAHKLISSGVEVNQVDDSGSSALHYAGQSRPCLEVLLKHRADVRITNNDGLTPFLYAISTASSEAEPDLEPLARISSPRSVDDEGKTALHIAAERGLLKTTRLLLKYRADTTLVDPSGRRPLLLAVLAHQWSVVPLLATQPGINGWDEEGMTALHHIVTSIPTPPATWKDIAAATAKFCEKGISRTMRNRKGATPLIAAVMTLPEEGLPVIQTLLREDATERGSGRSNCIGHEDHKQKSALYHAVTLEKPAFVLALLRSGAPFRLDDWTLDRLPFEPITPKHRECLKLLAEHEWLRRSRVLNRSSGTVLPTSLLPKLFPLTDLEELLALGLDPNSLPAANPKLRGSLLWTILNQTLTEVPMPPEYLHDVLQLIIQFKADVTVVTAHRTAIPVQKPDPKLPTRCALTFLLEEFSTINIDVIMLLLEHGADLTTPSLHYQGRFPLHSAVRANRMDVVQEFLARKADVNALDEKKQSPLFIAAEKSFWEIVDLLMKHKAQVNIRDVEDATPLHMAAAGGSAIIVSTLLRAGASALAKNSKGQTPLACVPEALEEREKAKMTRSLTAYQQREESEIEDKKRRVERQKKLEEQEKLRKERLLAEETERQERLRKEKAQASLNERLRKEREQAAEKARLQKEREQAQRPASPKQPFFWSLRGRGKSLGTKSSSKQLTSMKSTPVLNTTSFESSMGNLLGDTLKGIGEPVKSSMALRSASATHLSPTSPTNGQKPAQPRADSGLGQVTLTTEKPLPVSERTQKTSDGPSGGKVEVSEELDSWLAMSKLLDRL